MMPKGVEHKVAGANTPSSLAVISSLMPKGVEHKLRNQMVAELNA